MQGFVFKPPSPEIIEKAFSTALKTAKEQIFTDTNYFVRVDQGTLKDTSYIKENGMEIEIVWPQKYAKRVYYTGTPSKDQNPNASLMWAQKAADTYGKDWERILQKNMNQQG